MYRSRARGSISIKQLSRDFGSKLINAHARPALWAILEDDLGLLSHDIETHCVKGKLPLKQANNAVNLSTESITLALVKKAGWQSGYAADCNSVHAGSIPTPASI